MPSILARKAGRSRLHSSTEYAVGGASQASRSDSTAGTPFPALKGTGTWAGQ